MTGRDEEGRLVCSLCKRSIPALTGLEELHNFRAHIAEHHEEALDLSQVMIIRQLIEEGRGPRFIESI